MNVRAISLTFIVVWFALGLYVIQQGLELRLGSISSPGTGFMPFVIGIVLIGFCIASAMPLLPRSGLGERLQIQRLRDPAIVVTAMAAYVLVLERVGFLASTAILIAFLSMVVGRMTLFRAAMLGVLAPAACYVVFGMLLGVRLP
jgi:hypothetical protein